MQFNFQMKHYNTDCIYKTFASLLVQPGSWCNIAYSSNLEEGYNTLIKFSFWFQAEPWNHGCRSPV